MKKVAAADFTESYKSFTDIYWKQIPYLSVKISKIVDNLSQWLTDFHRVTEFLFLENLYPWDILENAK